MRLIDGNNLLDYLKNVVIPGLPEDKPEYARGKKHMVHLLTNLIISGAFDPAPQAQLPVTDDEENINEIPSHIVQMMATVKLSGQPEKYTKIEIPLLQTLPGDTYRAEVKTIKKKNSVPTVISMDGRLYNLQPAYQHKGDSKNAK